MQNLTIGITGGIGSGKSVVSRVLRCNGFKVYDCDYQAKELMTSDLNLKKALISNLGERSYDSDGKLNRREVARIIFEDAEKRETVNALVHAAVRKDIKTDREEEKGYFFIESAIIFTGGIADFCDKIWYVTASLKTRFDRVSRRDHISEHEIMKRIQSQEKEFEHLPTDKTIVFNNENNNPILVKILDLTSKLNYTQKYTILC